MVSKLPSHTMDMKYLGEMNMEGLLKTPEDRTVKVISSSEQTASSRKSFG